MTDAEPQAGKIGLMACTAFAVGTMVGAGVFVLSGIAVQRTGPAALVSFALAGLLVLLSALSFAVVASVAPPGGSGYAYVGVALGGYWRFVASWSFYVGGLIGAAFVLSAFGTYTHEFFFQGWPVIPVALGAAAAVTLLNLGPASAIGRAEMVLVGAKIIVLVVLIGFAFAHLGRAHFTPFTPHGTGTIASTSALLFVAYLGFNVVTNMAGDVDRPHRTIPLAILLSMAIVLIIYLGVVVAVLAGNAEGSGSSSVGVAAEHLMGTWGRWLIPAAALVSTLSSANANVLGSAEIMVRMAHDRDVPTAAGSMWKGHPIVAVVFGSIVYGVLIAIGHLTAIVSLANVAAIIAMTLVNLAAAHAMYTRAAGALRLPGGPVLPLIGLVAALSQLFFLPIPALIAGTALVFGGSLVYVLRERLHHPAAHRTLVDIMKRADGPVSRALRAGGLEHSIDSHARWLAALASPKIAASKQARSDGDQHSD